LNIKEYFGQFKPKNKEYKRIAKLCNVSPTTVRSWDEGVRVPSRENAKKFEKASKGQVTHSEALFPDVKSKKTANG
jgi:DNA-binding transcriptional regulator YdaS (Cro superfamily)